MVYLTDQLLSFQIGSVPIWEKVSNVVLNTSISAIAASIGC